MSRPQRRQIELKRQYSQWDGSHQFERQEFFERIQDDEDSPETVRAAVSRPNNIGKQQEVYKAHPEPVNSGERYMREHYNNGQSVPEVIDKSCCGVIKRHKFRFLLIILAIAFLIGLIIFGILYFAF